jgi:hypothetical protein
LAQKASYGEQLLTIANISVYESAGNCAWYSSLAH